jgi:hypothetical protein
MMGNAQIMPLKILWDFAVYWGFFCQLTIHEKLIDPAFMVEAREILLKLAGLNANVQRTLRQWATATTDSRRAGFVDYAVIPFLQRLNADLLVHVDDAALLARLRGNLALLHTLRAGLLAVSDRGPGHREGEALWALPFAALGLRTPAT